MARAHTAAQKCFIARSASWEKWYALYTARVGKLRDRDHVRGNLAYYMSRLLKIWLVDGLGCSPPFGFSQKQGPYSYAYKRRERNEHQSPHFGERSQQTARHVGTACGRTRAVPASESGGKLLPDGVTECRPEPVARPDTMHGPQCRIVETVPSTRFAVLMAYAGQGQQLVRRARMLPEPFDDGAAETLDIFRLCLCIQGFDNLHKLIQVGLQNPQRYGNVQTDLWTRYLPARRYTVRRARSQ